MNAPAGVYDVVGLTNWQSAAAVRRLDFAEKLGLERGQEYVAFDFWNQRLLGTFRMAWKRKWSRTIHAGPADPCEVRSSTGDRKFAAHFRGVSIRELSWEAASQKLQGVSETVAGEQYTLFIHVPPGYKAAQLRTSAGNATLDAGSQTGVVKLSLPDRNEPVKWEIEFVH